MKIIISKNIKNTNLFENISYVLLTFTFFMLINSCQKENEIINQLKLFTRVEAKDSGIDFKNEIIESVDFNYYNYIYSYNGAGVAASDFNNDGLIDLFFTSNNGLSHLYLNQGNFKFDDITASSGIKRVSGYKTGVSVVDINNDGYLDIYICRAGWFEDENKLANLLYINNGDLTFTEAAETYGLADKNRSINATFFDYDKDGDLDVYISNSPQMTKDYRKLLDFEDIQKSPNTIALKGSDKLYQNDGTGHFTDVSIEAGIMPDTGFGLNPQVADLNNDGWLDVYVSNDFETPDFAYVNNGDGTFTDQRETIVKHMSFYSMGSDVADINNDGFNDIVVLDMNPEDYIRSKTTMSMTSLDKFSEMVKKGYNYQYMHNMLQLNNGNGTFSEIANMSGIANTDWSWTPLLADFDLDGYNDIYVTNGVYRDVIDKDTNKKITDLVKQKGVKPTGADFLKYTKMLPQQKLTNYFFKNNKDLTFSNTTADWVESVPTFSNGAVYADLDNDGDLDIVVNNINEEATVLKNNARELNLGNYLKLEFEGSEKNKLGDGAIVTLFFDDGTKQIRQLINSRGYLSSVAHQLYFGFNKNTIIKSLEVKWIDGKCQKLTGIKSNQLITLKYAEADILENNTSKLSNIFKNEAFYYTHKDSVFDDYNIQILLPHKLSQLGPAIAKTDINGDGIDDIFLGGGYMQEGQILTGSPSVNGTFYKLQVNDFVLDKKYEDIGASFFDADNDGDEDLYVVSGSYEFGEDSPLLQDRLYINKGFGKFEKCTDCLPSLTTSGSVVVPADFDKDGDMDLFVGGRVIPGKYPLPSFSYLLLNKNGKYTIETNKVAPELQQIGMVTDAQWNDIDNDNDLDLIVTGEWMGIEVFVNEDGLFSKNEKYEDLANQVGWWNKLLIEDIDGDGDKDIVAGNLGLNSKYHATTEKPFHIYAKDFDQNGTEDVFLAKYYNGKQVPVRGKSCTAQQIPQLAEKIKSYQEFANNDLQGILGEDINTALHYKANEFRSGIFLNDGGKFIFKPFSIEVQKSLINSILFNDFDNDGKADLLMAGNNYQVEIETTRKDEGIGVFLKGKGKGEFEYIPTYKTGFFADKDVRNILQVKTSEGKAVIVINNDNTHQLFLVKNE